MEQKAANKKEVVGRVSFEEANEIKFLFERKNGLIELAKSLNDNNISLYDKIVTDLGIVSTKFDQWWNEKSTQYNWPNKVGHAWEINFSTGEIYLAKVAQNS
jgi:CXXX repeat modification system protein